MAMAMDMGAASDPLELQLLKAAVENARDGIMVTDAELEDPGPRILFVNRALEVMTGYEGREMLGRTPRMLQGEETLAEFRRAVRQALREGRTFEGETVNRRKDGSTYVVSLTIAPITDAQGRVSHYVSVERDVTEARRRDRDLSRLNAELEDRVHAVTHQIRRQALAMDAISEGMAILEGETYVYVNPAHAAMYGYRPEEQVGRTWRMLYGPDEIRRIEGTAFSALQSTGRWSGTALGLRKDGTTFDVELNLTVTPTGDLVCACRDITERRAGEEALRRANLELASASRAKDAFLASMSHELRTPLAGILAMVELLDAELHGPLNKHQAGYVRSIDASGRHLLELISDILDLAKVGSGTMELTLDECSVDEICQAGVRLVDDAARKKGHAIELSLPGPRLRILADARRLKQILVNLLDNAVKFTPPGRRIGLRAFPREGPATPGGASAGEVCLEVWDTGIGIPAEVQGRLFEPFFQIDSSLARAHAGTGLGLALVRKLVELHRGRIEFESRVDEGSRFRVCLPVLDAAEREDLSHAARLSPPGPEPRPAPSVRVLVAEDNPINATAFRSYLGARGFDIRVAGDGVEAVELVARWQPHVVVMDVQMPRLDGLSAVRRLRADPDPRVSRVPILVVTAYAMPGDEEVCLASGADGYLSKPVNLRKVCEWVTSHAPPVA